EHDAFPLHVAEIPKAEPERVPRRCVAEQPDARNRRRRLRLSGEGRGEKETDRENNREPRPPHGTPRRRMNGGSLANPSSVGAESAAFRAPSIPIPEPVIFRGVCAFLQFLLLSLILTLG